MQFSLTQLAAQIEGSGAAHDPQHAADLAAGVHPDIAEGNAFGRYEAEQERRAYELEMEEERAMGLMSEEEAAERGLTPATPAQEPEELFGDTVVQATPEMIREALENGGRAAVTIRSRVTGAHVKVVFSARLREGERFIPRNQVRGRVGIGEATVLEGRDPEREYPDNYVGRLYLDTGEWRAGRDADRARTWAAEAVIGYALGGGVYERTEFFLQTQCSHCGRPLTDPESIQRLVGPECYGRATGSRHARYDLPR